MSPLFSRRLRTVLAIPLTAWRGVGRGIQRGNGHHLRMSSGQDCRWHERPFYNVSSWARELRREFRTFCYRIAKIPRIDARTNRLVVDCLCRTCQAEKWWLCDLIHGCTRHIEHTLKTRPWVSLSELEQILETWRMASAMS